MRSFLLLIRELSRVATARRRIQARRPQSAADNPAKSTDGSRQYESTETLRQSFVGPATRLVMKPGCTFGRHAQVLIAILRNKLFMAFHATGARTTSSTVQ